MTVLEQTYFGNTVLTWLAAMAVAVLAGGALAAVKALAARRLRAVARRTATDLDNLFVEQVGRTRRFAIVAVALYAGALVPALPPAADRAIVMAAGLAVLAQAALWGNGIITFAVSRYTRARLEQDAATATTIAVLSFVAKLILWTAVLLVALDNLGVNITTLVAGVGISGIAVALAVQNFLGDVFSAFSIALDKPFVIGDFIIVDDLLGTVEHIGLKTTRVRSLSGEQLIFANSDLLRSRIRNFKRMSERRVAFTFGVTYETRPELLAAIPVMVRRIVDAQSPVRFARAHFKTYGDFALIFEVVYFVQSPDYNVYMDVQQAINLDLYRQFQQAQIEFAYPTRTVYVRTPADAAPLRPAADHP